MDHIKHAGHHGLVALALSGGLVAAVLVSRGVAYTVISIGEMLIN